MEQDRLDNFMTLIVSASRSITKLKSRYMAHYGLGSTHTICIRKLFFSNDGLTRTQLADQCELDKAQISRIINELSEKGFVTEGKGGSNYKKKVVLTDIGKKTAREINDTVLTINSFVSEKISHEDINVFYSVFGEICENLKVAEDKFK